MAQTYVGDWTGLTLSDRISVYDGNQSGNKTKIMKHVWKSAMIIRYEVGKIADAVEEVAIIK